MLQTVTYCYRNSSINAIFQLVTLRCYKSLRCNLLNMLLVTDVTLVTTYITINTKHNNNYKLIMKSRADLPANKSPPYLVQLPNMANDLIPGNWRLQLN